MTTLHDAPFGLDEDLPHNISAEQAVLGGLMLGGTAEGLAAADFYRPGHRLIFEAIEALLAAKEPTGAIAVANEMSHRGTLGRINGADYIHDCLAAIPSAAQTGYFAAIVREHAERRGYLEQAARLRQLALNPATDMTDVRAAASAGPAALTGSRLDELRGALLNSAALDSIPAPQPVIDGLLYRDSLAWLHGKPGHGKSFVALDWAGCISTGLSWQWNETTQGVVLYLIAEGTPGLQRRVRAWEDYTGHTMLAEFLPMAIQLLNPADAEAFIALTAELQPALVVIDTQARVTVGLEENSARDTGLLVAAADRIRAASHACVLMVHHEARAGENMRGSTSLEGAATSIMRVTKDGANLTLKTTKQKDSVEADPIALRLVPRLGSAVIKSHDEVGVTDELTSSQATILETLRDSFGSTGAPSTRLREQTGLRDSTFYRSLERLVSGGLIVNTGTKRRPHYELPSRISTT